MILAKHVFGETVDTNSLPAGVKPLNDNPLLGTVFVKADNNRKTINMLFLDQRGKVLKLSGCFTLPKAVMETAFELYTAVSNDDTKFETGINIYDFGSILLTTEYLDHDEVHYIKLKAIDIRHGELWSDDLPMTNDLLSQLGEASKVQYTGEGSTGLSFLRFEKNGIIVNIAKGQFGSPDLEGYAFSNTTLYGEQVIRRFLYEMDSECRKALTKQS